MTEFQKLCVTYGLTWKEIEHLEDLRSRPEVQKELKEFLDSLDKQ